jgi:hypothetical protein
MLDELTWNCFIQFQLQSLEQIIRQFSSIPEIFCTKATHLRSEKTEKLL